ncbi:hypothetical protein OQA88_2870 [Cercophora sp. LCS_1]
MFRPQKPEDWEGYKDTIAALYNENKLKDVMKEMEKTWSFKATEKQYKTQIKKWNLDTKYIKASEYMAMIKIKRAREKENPPKKTRFALRGRFVDPKDITRFEKRASKKGKSVVDDDDDQGVEDLMYDTPNEDEGEYSYAEATTSYGTGYEDSSYYGGQYSGYGGSSYGY